MSDERPRVVVTEQLLESVGDLVDRVQVTTTRYQAIDLVIAFLERYEARPA